MKRKMTLSLLDIIGCDPGGVVMSYLDVAQLGLLASTSTQMRDAVYRGALHAHLSQYPFSKALLGGHRYAVRYLFNTCPWIRLYAFSANKLIARVIRAHGVGFIEFLASIGCPLTRAHTDTLDDIDKLVYFRDVLRLPPTRGVMLTAAREDNVQLLRYVHENGMTPDADVMAHAYREGNLAVTKYLVEAGIAPPANAVEDALNHGFYGGLACYLAEHCTPDQTYVDEVLRCVDIPLYRDILEVWLRRGVVPSLVGVDAHARAGNTEVLGLLRGFGVYPSKRAQRE
jgi:hypothetical protein